MVIALLSLKMVFSGSVYIIVLCYNKGGSDNFLHQYSHMSNTATVYLALPYTHCIPLQGKAPDKGACLGGVSF